MIMSGFVSGGLAAGPKQAALHNLARLGYIKIREDMPECAVGNTAGAPLARPCHRHHGAGNPRRVCAIKCCGRKHLIVGVNVHVVLL